MPFSDWPYDVYVNDDCNAGGWGCGHMMSMSMTAMQEVGLWPYDVYVNDCNAGGWGCGHMMCMSMMTAMQE